MKNNEKHKLSEMCVRLMCFFLGVLLTLSGILIKEKVFLNGKKTDKERDMSVTKIVEPEIIQNIEEQEMIGDSHVAVSVLENYSKEVEQKIQALKEQPVLEADDSVNATTRVISNMDGKPSKLNWKPFYAAINSTIGITLAQKEKERSSYEETMATNAFDKKIIEESTIDFSGVKIAILGDSLTAGNTLSDEDKDKFNYPAVLSKILGCEVVNLGIGGSTVSSCATNYPMVERWSSIPKDSDIVIVFGGTNDCLFETRDQFGFLDYERRMNEDTFCGDLDRMLGAMKYTYHDNMNDRYVRLIYINPPSTILNDGVVAVDPNKYVPQWEYAQAINEIAPNYGFDVIDFYNTNLLNSHDYTIGSEFIRDGVHGNIAGYQIMAEHIASEIIQMIQQ